MPPTGGPSRVVLVEDDPVLRELVRIVLDTSPALELVAEAGDGAAALRAVEEHRPEMVVLDLGLPDITGQDVLTQIRERAPWVRVLLFTGSTTATDDDAVGWGAAGVVRKDQDLSHLVRTLEQVAGTPRTAATDLGRSHGSPSEARRFVEGTLSGWRCDTLLDDALLVVSELVTNAVTHASSDCRLELRLATGSLRIQVTDTGSGSPEPQAIDLARASGRGLLLVSALSRAWGIDPVGGGKVVWAELAA